MSDDASRVPGLPGARAVHLAMTLVMVATASIIVQLGLHLRLVLGHWPRSCLDNPSGLGVSVTAHASMYLFLLAYCSAPLWLVLTPMLALTDGAPRQRRNLLLCVLAYGAAVWLLSADPTHGLDWLLD